MSEATTKAEFMKQLEAGRVALWMFIHTLSHAQMEGKRDPAGWAIKDHLIHLAIWERGIAAMLKSESRWAAMGLDYEMVRGLLAQEPPDFDRINDLIFQATRQMSAAEALDTLRVDQAEMDRVLAPLDDAALQKSYDEYQPMAKQPSPEYGKTPVMTWLVADTYEHYQEHLPWMGALLGS